MHRAPDSICDPAPCFKAVGHVVLLGEVGQHTSANYLLQLGTIAPHEYASLACLGAVLIMEFTWHTGDFPKASRKLEPSIYLLFYHQLISLHFLLPSQRKGMRRYCPQYY